MKPYISLLVPTKVIKCYCGSNLLLTLEFSPKGSGTASEAQ